MSSAVEDKASDMHLFSKFNVSNQIFYYSKLSLGLVNLMPLVPGHVLVIPRRVLPRMADLSEEEVADLFTSARRIGNVIEREFKSSSLTIACQDGPEAGQSVPHCHVHVMPRHKNDFEPVDRIYDVMQKEGARGAVVETAGERGEKLKMDADRKPRSAEEMETEAKWLSSFFPGYQDKL